MDDSISKSKLQREIDFQEKKSTQQQTYKTMTVKGIHLEKPRNIRHIYDRNGKKIGNHIILKVNHKDEIVGVIMTKIVFMKAYPKVSFAKTDILKMDQNAIWLKITKKEFNELMEIKRLEMIEKQKAVRPKKRTMILWGLGYEYP